VLRLGRGDIVEAFDGLGNVLTVRLQRVGGRFAEGALLARAALRSESPLHLTLAQSIPKGDKMEGIIRMATELGAARVVPLVTARTVVRVEPERAGPRLSRWQRVARESAKQTGRAVVIEVTTPKRLVSWIAARETEGLLVCLWEDAREPLGPQLPQGPVSRATVVVGPEGGLERAEHALGTRTPSSEGLAPHSRTETAGPVGLASCKRATAISSETAAEPRLQPGFHVRRRRQRQRRGRPWRDHAGGVRSGRPRDLRPRGGSGFGRGARRSGGTRSRHRAREAPRELAQ
jgi:16S rRNA (uracil1498-N3)-methyltransferase